jgi:hypothetical protein
MGSSLTGRVRGGMGSFAEWKRDRDADIARAGAQIQARADQLVRKAIRAGQEISAKTPSELREFVKTAATLSLPRAGTTAPANHVARRPPNSSRSPPPRPSTPGARPSGVQQVLAYADRIKTETTRKGFEILERAAANDPRVAKVIGDMFEKAGQAAGAAKSALQTAEDLKDGAIFVTRLVNPLDPVLSAPGQSAADQVVRGARQAVDDARSVIADPQRAVRSIIDKGRQMHRDLDPAATPQGHTAGDELRRRFDIGRNQGDLGMDAAALIVGGPSVRGVSGAARASNIGNVAKYSAQGFTPAKAEHLAQRYDGKGHHAYIKERDRLPKLLGGGPYPPWVLDNPLNLHRPHNMTRGDFYVTHALSDRHFGGAGFPRSAGGGGRGSGWSAKRLGIETAPLPLRAIYGMPDAMKLLVGSGAIAAGAYANEALDSKDSR